MPVYNEEKDIAYTVMEWLPFLSRGGEDSRLLLINDGSTDHTKEILDELQRTYPSIDIISRANKGHGPTVLEAYRYAINHGADYVFQTDSDGQTSPYDFMTFWHDREKYDAIFGNRSIRKDGESRKKVEKILCKMLRLYFGIKIPDANAPYRLFKAEKLKKYIDMIPDDYILPNVMLTVFYCKNKESCAFKEISFHARETGVSSINLKKIFQIGFQSIFDFWKFRNLC